MQPRSATFLLLLLLACASPILADEPVPPPTASTPADRVAELLRQEEVRQVVEAAFALYTQPTDDGAVENDRFVRAADLMVEAGEDVVPFLAVEIAQTVPWSYYLSAYTLGRIGGEAAREALRAAAAAAEIEGGDFARVRKGWACYGLALAGDVASLDLIDSGRHDASLVPIHGGVSALEASALQTAPASIERLFAKLDQLDDENDPRRARRNTVIGALGRVASPAALPGLSRVLGDANPVIAAAAATAISRIDDPRSAALLVDALEAPDLRLRRAAALGLVEAVPADADAVDRLFAALDEAEGAVARGALYRAAARSGGVAVTERLAAAWGRSDALDRMELVRALGSLRTTAAIPTLTRAFNDPTARVRSAAAAALVEVGDAAALEPLVAGLDDEHWPVMRAAMDALIDAGYTAAGAPVADRLIDVELSGVVTDPAQRDRVQLLSQALIDLRAPLRLDALRDALARQTDPVVTEQLKRDLALLELLARNGRKDKRWIAVLDDERPAARRLAYEELARSGDPRRAATLVSRFAAVIEDKSEATAILNALGRFDTAAARRLVASVLSDPAFDPVEREPLRDMAAWSARRLGGADMAAALRAQIERRQGRDALPLVYYAALEGRAALPVLERFRIERMRFLRWSRGAEQDRLDWIARELLAGRSIDVVDVPPDEIEFR